MPTEKIEKEHLERIFNQFTPVKVKYKDIFDMKEFYTALYYWLMEYGWSDSNGTKEGKSPGKERFETLYNEKISPDGKAKEHFIRWRLKKMAPDTNKMRYYIDINFHTIALTSAEVVRDGQKIKANKGEVEITIHAFIEKIYETELGEHKLLKYFKDLFIKRIYKQEFETRKKELYQEIYVLQNFIKQWFKLKRYLPYEETKSFFPSYAWPSHIREQKD